MPTVRAAVCHSFKAPLSIEEVELRRPLPGEVEVTLAACAICFSDISFIDGGWGGTLPAVYGHEAAGHVSGVGAGVQGYREGDPVIVTLMRHCGTCPTCATGHPSRCETPYDRNKGPLAMPGGGVLHHGLKAGAFAERVVVSPSQIAPIPAAMPMDAASLLSCGVITGVGAVVNTAKVRPGEIVVVIGAGGVGLNVIQGARISGAARIVAVDLNEGKLAAAKEFGATDGVIGSGDAPWETARAAAGGRKADVVFVSVGAIPAFDAALNYLAPGGRMVMVGMPHSGAFATYEPVSVAGDAQAMIGSVMGDTVLVRDIRWMTDLWAQGRLKLAELISGRWRLDQINEAIADTRGGAARRNVIMFG